jgi:hypothetical protein
MSPKPDADVEQPRHPYRIYEIDPLTCTRCGAPMKIRAFIIAPAVIQRVLNHLDNETFVH